VNIRAQAASNAIASKPPFRAEHIGSLLRPAELLRQRARFAKGEIDNAELAAAEDDAIRSAIRLQERIGFKFVTDGEFRRRSYHSFFYGELGDLRIDTIGGANAQGGIPAMQPSLKRIRIAGRKSRFRVLALCISAAAITR
jgi:5-methyltetrahydropteroyltriglutamate--homocysteine methyltransferase